jgi:ribonuclease III
VPKASSKSLDALSGKLGHEFSDANLLQRALTHSSARTRGPKTYDYERLEFLGDRVLGLVIAELLIARYPDAREGDLAQRFNRLVRKETCAEIAERLNLGDHVIMSTSEADSGGRGKLTILGDACEAVLGAIFLDAGYDKARTVIRTLWGDMVNDNSTPLRDAKSALQEWAQGRGRDLPLYVDISRQGPDHAPLFIIEVEVQGLKPAQGKGPSKRIAEQAAANAMLLREGIWKNDQN